MKQVYAPGCALMIYKPHLAKKVLKFLNEELGDIPEHLICCNHEPNLESDTVVINTCPGCDRRYRELYDGISTVSLWEVLAWSKNFPFPDYKGMEMAIHDACPTRTETRVHSAIRALLEKMNIKVVEPKNSGTKATCCGDSFYGALPVEQVKDQMKKRANEMPCENVVVYCVSCIKSMHIGGKRPRYIVDLLFGEETEIGTYEPDEWHDELKNS
ncbi:(Fe-S)-binding protein [Lutispora thermophila]|uniref:Cysteine-rich domain-containing protein n=1 Tax=Lutispora thermophila DSM 19022 TaxID=1122184 RepID=A0A1M6CKS6_9FIRM|nr:(Fe-S)-binding protein [Lutispora thermophila]SHI61610.1 Cysteine-rich domain-containing protein [Lutispora thermophila DSM 19022]